MDKQAEIEYFENFYFDSETEVELKTLNYTVDSKGSDQAILPFTQVQSFHMGDEMTFALHVHTNEDYFNFSGDRFNFKARRKFKNPINILKFGTYNTFHGVALHIGTDLRCENGDVGKPYLYLLTYSILRFEYD